MDNGGAGVGHEVAEVKELEAMNQRIDSNFARKQAQELLEMAEEAKAMLGKTYGLRN